MSGGTKTVSTASCSTPHQAVHFNSAAILLDKVDIKVAHQETDGDRCTSFAANGPQHARAAHQVQHQVQVAGWFRTTLVREHTQTASFFSRTFATAQRMAD